MQRQSVEPIVRDFVGCINNGDIDGIAALTSPTYTFTDMEGEVYILEGRESVKESWNEYLSAYPDYKIVVHNILCGGEGVAIVGQTTGSHLPPDVERKEVVLWIAEIVEGLISEWRIYSTLMCRETRSRLRHH